MFLSVVNFLLGQRHQVPLADSGTQVAEAQQEDVDLQRFGTREALAWCEGCRETAAPKVIAAKEPNSAVFSSSR